MSNSSDVVFSVLMSVYNTPEDILCRAIDSVREQIFEKWELIILENGSNTEEQWDIITAYAKDDTRIKIIKAEDNVGWPKAASICLKEATGQYMTFLAADDWLSGRDCFNVLQEEIDKNNPDVIWCGWMVTRYVEGRYDILGGRIPQYHLLESENRLDNFLTVLNEIYYNAFFHYVKIDLLKKFNIDFFDNFYGDCCGMTEALCQAENMVVLDKAVYNLTRNTSQTRGVFLWEGYKTIYSVQWNSLMNALKREGFYDDEYYKYIAGVFFNSMLGVEISGLCNGNKTRDRYMKPLAKNNLQRLCMLEQILEDSTMGEIMHYYGRQQFAEVVMEEAKKLFITCMEEYEIDEIEKSSKWLSMLVEGLYEISESGNLIDRTTFTDIEYKCLEYALSSKDNNNQFGLELIIKNDNAVKSNPEFIKYIIMQVSLCNTKRIYDILESADEYRNKKYSAVSLKNLREGCQRLVEGISIQDENIKKEIDTLKSKIEIELQE